MQTKSCCLNRTVKVQCVVTKRKPANSLLVVLRAFGLIDLLQWRCPKCHKLGPFPGWVKLHVCICYQQIQTIACLLVISPNILEIVQCDSALSIDTSPAALVTSEGLPATHDTESPPHHLLAWKIFTYVNFISY